MTPLHLLAQSEAPRDRRKCAWDIIMSFCNPDTINHKDYKKKLAQDYMSHEDKKFFGLSSDESIDLSGSIKSTLSTSVKELPLKKSHPQKSRNQTNHQQQEISEDAPQKLLADTIIDGVSLETLDEKLENLLSKDDSYFQQNDSQNSDSDNSERLSESDIEDKQEEDKGQDEHSTTTTDIKVAPAKSVPITDSKSKEEEETLDFDGKLWYVQLLPEVTNFIKNNVKLGKLALQKIAKIADGDWNEKNRKRMSDKIELYEARLTDAARILWVIKPKDFSQKDSEKVNMDGVSIYSEVIYVHAIILKHDRVPHHVKLIENRLPDDSEPSHTVLIPDKQSGRRIPKKWINADSAEKLDEITARLEARPEVLSNRVRIGIQKSQSLTTSVALNLLQGTRSRRDYPLKVTDEEYNIIKLPEKDSILLLGRSGTGKTTTCLCRMWNIFSQYWTGTEVDNPRLPGMQGQLDTHSHLHQVFITKNKVLCKKMKTKFYDFLSAFEDRKNHLDMEKKQYPKLSDISELSFPIFITARDFFCLLDKSLDDGKKFLKENTEILSSDYEHEKRRLQHLELDYDDSNMTKVMKRKSQVQEVTAQYFMEHIWKCIKHSTSSQDHDVGVHPELVWMEIESFIKGSRESLKTKDGYLSLEEYKDTGGKRAPNFKSNRDVIYEFFEEYTKIKHKDGTKHYFDNCDFMHNLYKRVKGKGLPIGIHRFYIDEVQDFTEVELAVIFECCKVYDGFFFSGDTAQCIMKGISFRFEDIKSMFKDFNAIPPKWKKLTVNHRSHSGITQLAASVIELLSHYFPYSLDWRKVPVDKSHIEGPKPVLITSSLPIDELFVLLRGDHNESSIDFGADQAVIVRDEEAVKNIPKFLSSGIVLSIPQCKGLEFNDVLLFNFFSDMNVSC